MEYGIRTRINHPCKVQAMQQVQQVITKVLPDCQSLQSLENIRKELRLSPLIKIVVFGKIKREREVRKASYNLMISISYAKFQ
jgi:hypothetical protein